MTFKSRGAAAWLALILTLLGGALFAAEDQPSAPGAAPLPLATIGLSEEFVLHSEAVDQDFLIQVAKPILPLPPNAKPPVVYVVDGFTTMSLTSTLTRLLPLEGLAEPAYVVAIGYPVDNLLEVGALRARDLVHAETENNGAPFGGGGAAFETFVMDELRPVIEARYPVDPERSVLGGHSLGGLFTARVLAHDPHAFAGYMIGSPSLQFDPALADDLRAAAPQGDGRRVFIGEGAREDGMTAFADAVETALTGPGSRFDVAHTTFPDETHVSVLSPFLSHGLRHVLPLTSPPVALPPLTSSAD